MTRLFALASLVCFGFSSSLFAQFEVTLDPATAGLTYLPSPLGPGVPGGLPDPYELHFGLQGMLTIEPQPIDVAKITQANYVLVGNDAAFQNDPQRRMQIQEISRQILLNAIFDIELGPPMDRTVFRADVAGPDLVLEFFRQTLVRMSGGPDQTFVDGEGYQYTYPIPEPTTVVLLLAACCCAGFWWVFRRTRVATALNSRK